MQEKADLKNATGVDTLDFSKKTDLANLDSDVDKLGFDKLRNMKSKVDKLDVDKLAHAPIDLSKLIDAVMLWCSGDEVMLLENIYVMLRSRILEMKYLILLT